MSDWKGDTAASARRIANAQARMWDRLDRKRKKESSLLVKKLDKKEPK